MFTKRGLTGVYPAQQSFLILPAERLSRMCDAEFKKIPLLFVFCWHDGYPLRGSSVGALHLGDSGFGWKIPKCYQVTSYQVVWIQWGDPICECSSLNSVVTFGIHLMSKLNYYYYKIETYLKNTVGAKRRLNLHKAMFYSEELLLGTGLAE